MGAFEPRAYGAPKSTKGPCTKARVASLCVLALYVQQEHATTFSGQYFHWHGYIVCNQCMSTPIICQNPNVLIVASRLMATHGHDFGKKDPPIMIESFQNLTAESSRRTSKRLGSERGPLTLMTKAGNKPL